MVENIDLTIEGLAAQFTDLHVDFKKLEDSYDVKRPTDRRSSEKYLKEFASFLSGFSDLQFKLLRLSVTYPDNGDVREHIEVINGVLNKIQFLYMVPISQELSRSYNIFNIRLAVFSILFGVLMNFCQPYLQPYAKPYLDKLFGVVEISSKPERKLEKVEKPQSKVAMPKVIHPVLPQKELAQPKGTKQ